MKNTKQTNRRTFPKLIKELGREQGSALVADVLPIMAEIELRARGKRRLDALILHFGISINYIAKTDGSNDYCYEENGKVNKKGLLRNIIPCNNSGGFPQIFLSHDRFLLFSTKNICTI